MILRTELEKTARSYLRAARVLNRSSVNSPDASVYLCGYAVEIALKARTCRTLGWLGFPSTTSEFRNYRSFQTHDLEVLLHLAGHRAENRIKADPIMQAEWSTVELWNPEQRYNPLGTKTQADAEEMIKACARILEVLL